MALLAPARCSVGGCRRLTTKGRCRKCRRKKHQASYPSGSSTARGYGVEWRRMRDRVLAEEPVCQRCDLAASEQCDHIVPKELWLQSPELWLQEYDRVVGRAAGEAPPSSPNVRSNLQGICGPCHKSKTGRDRRRLRKLGRTAL